MKKRWTAILLSAVMTMMCAGCNSDSNETEKGVQGFTPRLNTEEKVSFNIIGCMANFESLEAIITDFEVYYPNCEILYSTVSNSDEYWSMLESRLKSDTSVGLFMMSNKFYTSDYIKEVCDDLQNEDIDLSAIQPEVISSSTIDGKLYEIPIMHNAAGLIVNKTLLKNCGLDIPKNYSEFLDACEKLKQAGYVPIQGTTYYLNSQLMRPMSYVLMNNTFKDSSDTNLKSIEEGKEGSAVVLQPVFDTLDTMYKNGYTNNEVNTTYTDSYNGSILKFFEGDVPFLVGTTETLSGMKKRETKSEHFSTEPFEYVFMTTPFAEDGAYCYLENWYGFSVSNNCSNKEWAVEFLRFITTNEEINKLAYIKGLPSVASQTDDDRFIGLYTEREDYRCTIDTFFPTAVQTSLELVEQDLANGKISVDNAVSEMERRLREGDLSESE